MKALNMELEPVRTVLANSGGEVSVCADTSGPAGLYTVVSILDRDVGKQIAGRVAVEGMFAQNRDFLGSFMHRDALCLVFVYREENRLSGREQIYAAGFPGRKAVALDFLRALAEIEAAPDIGSLLLEDRNINLKASGGVYLNYFLDFSRFNPGVTQEEYLRDAARYAFEILTREYAARYGHSVEQYPSELRLMYKKLNNRSFRSIRQIMAFVRGLSDQQREQRQGALRLLDAGASLWRRLAENPAGIFLGAVVLVTVLYLGYQLAVRAMIHRETRDNTVYVGMETIGEVSLGEPDL